MASPIGGHAFDGLNLGQSLSGRKVDHRQHSPRFQRAEKACIHLRGSDEVMIDTPENNSIAATSV